jgi:hypothetical protein
VKVPVKMLDQAVVGSFALTDTVNVPALAKMFEAPNVIMFADADASDVGPPVKVT